MYLSGTDKDHTVDWQFQCTSGRKSGSWTTIPVPSNWEMQGFGKYTYGYNPAPNEHGLYKYTFTPSARLRDKRTFLVFEGSMTDTDAKINGVSVGPIHQGAFYRFKYDVTNLLHYGEPNLLQVTVLKDSTDASINRAERLSDYWVFRRYLSPRVFGIHPHTAHREGRYQRSRQWRVRHGRVSQRRHVPSHADGADHNAGRQAGRRGV